MNELLNKIKSLLSDIEEALARLNIKALESKLLELQKDSADPSLWENQDTAGSLMKEISNYESRIKPWRDLEKTVTELKELASLDDDSLLSDLTKQYKISKSIYDKQKSDLLFNGPYDDHDAIVSIHAGAGGTDAQDWTQMLQRMYIRWAEKTNLKTTIVDESVGEEAGIKSATFEIAGPFVFGKLQGEHGVHRLVRLSPFNSDNLRQTSFAKVEVMPKIDKPEDIEIDEKDLKIDVYRSGGKGGQSVNTTDSAVRITHVPTGIVVAIQNERSQLQNKETAMTIMRSKLAQLQIEQHASNLRELKGPNEQAAWGNQIRSYVLHPYKQVKDLRTRYESSDPEAVLDGKLDDFINAFLEHELGA